MKINPDPHKDGFELQPTDNVTAELSSLETAQEVAKILGMKGVGRDAVNVYIGEEGLEKIDLDGQEHGLYAFLLRSIQHISHEWRIHESAKTALEEGRVLISIQTDGSEDQIETVVRELKPHDAEKITFWGSLATKHF